MMSHSHRDCLLRLFDVLVEGDSVGVSPTFDTRKLEHLDDNRFNGIHERKIHTFKGANCRNIILHFALSNTR